MERTRNAKTKQFFGLQLDRGNLSNALTDNLLKDMGMSSNDYNNVRFLLPSPRTQGHQQGTS